MLGGLPGHAANLRHSQCLLCAPMPCVVHTKQNCTPVDMFCATADGSFSFFVGGRQSSSDSEIFGPAETAGMPG